VKTSRNSNAARRRLSSPAAVIEVLRAHGEPEPIEISAAGREPVVPGSGPGQQDGEEIGRPLRGVVHAAPEQCRLTGHGSIV